MSQVELNWSFVLLLATLSVNGYKIELTFYHATHIYIQIVVFESMIHCNWWILRHKSALYSIGETTTGDAP